MVTLLSQDVMARKSCVGEKARSEILSVAMPSLGISTSLLRSPVVEVAAGAALVDPSVWVAAVLADPAGAAPVAGARP